MKKFLSILFATVFCVMMVAVVNAADVYVNDGGSGDGDPDADLYPAVGQALHHCVHSGGRRDGRHFVAHPTGSDKDRLR